MLTSKQLIVFYNTIHHQIQFLATQLSTANDSEAETIIITHNYLRAVRNQVIKLMILANQVSPEQPAKNLCAQIIANYLDEVTYISAAQDKEEIRLYQKQLAASHDSLSAELLENEFKQLIKEMVLNQKNNQAIAYHPVLKKILEQFYQAPVKNDANLIRDEIIAQLEILTTGRGQVLYENQFFSMPENPYVQMGIALRTQLAQNEPTPNDLYFALQLAQVSMNSLGKDADNYKDLKIQKFIQIKCKELYPLIKKDHDLQALLSKELRLRKLGYELLKHCKANCLTQYAGFDDLNKVIISFNGDFRPKNFVERVAQLKEALEKIIALNPHLTSQENRFFAFFRKKTPGEVFVKLAESGLKTLNKDASKITSNNKC